MAELTRLAVLERRLRTLAASANAQWGIYVRFLDNGEEIAIADDPQAIAENVAWLYQDEQAWTRLQQGGLAYIERTCSEQAVQDRFATLFARLEAG